MASYPYKLPMTCPGFDDGLGGGTLTGWTVVRGVPELTTSPARQGYSVLASKNTASSEIYQEVAIPADAYADADAGLLTARFRVWESGKSITDPNDTDTGWIGIRFYDASASPLGTETRLTEQHLSEGWTLRRVVASVPVGARTIRCTLYGTRRWSTALSVYWDDAELHLLDAADATTTSDNFAVLDMRQWYAGQDVAPVTFQIWTDETSPGGQRLLVLSKAAGISFIRWIPYELDLIDDPNQEVLILASAVVPQAKPGVWVRGQGNMQQGYSLLLNEDMQHYTIFRESQFASYVALGSAPLAWSLDTKYWMRLRVEGTTLKGKAWALGDPEPEAWGITVTDANYDRGTIGFSLRDTQYYSQSNYYCIGVGIGGATAPTPPPKLRPFTVTATPISDDEIDLSWPVQAQVDGYAVERAPDIGGASGYPIEITTLPGTTGAYPDQGLDPGVKYWYRVKVTVGNNSLYSYWVSATTLPAVGLSALRVSSHVVYIVQRDFPVDVLSIEGALVGTSEAAGDCIAPEFLPAAAELVGDSEVAAPLTLNDGFLLPTAAVTGDSVLSGGMFTEALYCEASIIGNSAVTADPAMTAYLLGDLVGQAVLGGLMARVEFMQAPQLVGNANAQLTHTQRVVPRATFVTVALPERTPIPERARYVEAWVLLGAAELIPSSIRHVLGAYARGRAVTTANALLTGYDTNALLGNAAIVGAGVLRKMAEAALSASGTLSGTVVLSDVNPNVNALVGQGVVTAILLRRSSIEAGIQGSASLSGSVSELLTYAAGAIAGGTATSSEAIRRTTGYGGLWGSSEAAANLWLGYSIVVELQGEGVLTGSAHAIDFPGGDLIGAGVLVGGSVLRGLTGAQPSGTGVLDATAVHRFLTDATPVGAAVTNGTVVVSDWV